MDGRSVRRSLIAPEPILLGVILSRRGIATRTRDLGQVATGRGLLLMALHQLNGHLVAATAYPVLEGQGELLASRLRLDS